LQESQAQLPLFSSLSVKDYAKLPGQPGIYIFLDKKNTCLYVGKAKNLTNRVSSYFNNKKLLDTKSLLLLEQIESIKFIVVESEIESFLLEANLIKKYNPKYNIKLKDSKTYPWIEVTQGEKFPRVTVTRRNNNKKSLYFGPYPNVGELKLVLKTIRRIFPYITVKNHAKKCCLYFHLGLCMCPMVDETKEKTDTYKKNIRNIIRIFKGYSAKNLIKDLEKERNKLSERQEYEKAQKIQKQISAIINTTSANIKTFEYESNPHLVLKLREKELEELKEILNSKRYKIEKLDRIECFDISNTSGKLSTGSMVVFIKGEKNASSYRRFRINPQNTGPNDYSMMKEVLQRRIRHLKEWGIPDLIIVDGGKPQISAALVVLKSRGLNFPVIGLAKKEETVITQDFDQIYIPKDSKALHLLKRLRNEAHRFAISYHRKLRSKFISA